MFPFIPFRAKEPGDFDYQRTYGECQLSKHSWIRVIWRWKGWKWVWEVIKFKKKKCISSHLWKLQTQIMSVTRKLYCRLTLGSFLTIQKHPASTGPPLLPWQADTHIPSPLPPLLLRSQWQSHWTRAKTGPAGLQSLKQERTITYLSNFMFAKNKTECVCSGTCYQTQVEWMFPVRELAGVDWWERDACHKYCNTTSLPSPSPDQHNSVTTSATWAPPCSSCHQWIAHSGMNSILFPFYLHNVNWALI